MKVQDVEIFRAEFKKIVYQKGLVADSEKRIRELSTWNKDGSHHNAVITEMNNRMRLKDKLKDMLKGVDYKDWQMMGKKVSALMLRYRNAEVRLRLAQDGLEKLIMFG